MIRSSSRCAGALLRRLVYTKLRPAFIHTTKTPPSQLPIPESDQKTSTHQKTSALYPEPDQKNAQVLENKEPVSPDLSSEKETIPTSPSPQTTQLSPLSLLEKQGRLTKKNCRILLNFCAKGGHFKFAVELLDRMKNLKIVDASAYKYVIVACFNDGQIQIAEEKFQEMQEAGFQPSLGLEKEILRYYISRKMGSEAEKHFNKMKQKDVESYNLVIEVSEAPENRSKYFQEMRKNGIEPNLESFNALIKRDESPVIDLSAIIGTHFSF